MKISESNCRLHSSICPRSMLPAEDIDFPRHQPMFKSTTLTMLTSQLLTLSWRSLSQRYLLHHSTPNTSLRMVH